MKRVREKERETALNMQRFVWESNDLMSLSPMRC